jgi:hypothetical protein
MLAILPNEKAPVLATVFGIVMALMSIWLFAICFRLVSGRRVSGGLVGPRALNAVAWLFLLLPLGGLFNGYFADHTLWAVVQSAIYVNVFFGLRALARSRRAQAKRIEDAQPPDPASGV